jgi:hypothetical protein
VKQTRDIDGSFSGDGQVGGFCGASSLYMVMALLGQCIGSGYSLCADCVLYPVSALECTCSHLSAWPVSHN